MAARHIVFKDLLQLTRDRRALMILLAMPLVFIAVLGFSTGRLLGWQDENSLLRVVVANETDDELAGELVRRLGSQQGIEVSMVDDRAAGKRAVDDGDSMAAIIIGEGFAGRVASLQLSDLLDVNHGAPTSGLASIDVHVYTRQTQSAMHGIIEQLVAASTMGVLLPHVARRNPIVAAYLDSMGTDPREPNALSGAPAMAVADATEPASDDSSRSQSRVYQIIVPGYTVMFAFFLINIMARSFLAEQQAGTLLRLRIAPIHRWQVLIGKTVPFLIISIVQGVLLFAFGKLLFGMSWGPQPWLLLLVISCTSLAATGLGLVTAVCVRSDAQVSAYANLLVITLAAVSGCFMPRAWLPETMRQISLATPHAWSLIAYDQLLNTSEPDVGRVLLSSGVLVLFFVGLTGLGFLRFRRLSSA